MPAIIVRLTTTRSNVAEGQVDVSAQSSRAQERAEGAAASAQTDRSASSTAGSLSVISTLAAPSVARQRPATPVPAPSSRQRLPRTPMRTPPSAPFSTTLRKEASPFAALQVVTAQAADRPRQQQVSNEPAGQSGGAG